MIKINKAGILTLMEGVNFGTALQTYALFNAIKLYFGNDVVFFPYAPFGGKQNKYTSSRFEDIKNRTELKLNLFNQFYKNYLYFSGDYIAKMTEAVDKEVNRYIVGSDTVWNMQMPEADSAFFLDFVKNPKNKKISYAPSFGGFYPEKIKRDVFSQNIPSFDFLSVREKITMDYVKQFTEKPVTHVCDPTLLLTKDDYKSIINNKEKPGGKDYILLYFILDRTENTSYLYNYVNRLAIYKDMSVVHFTQKIPSYVFGCPNESFAFDGPCEFLGLVKNASLVITNSYHGIMFSIIFRKPFYTFSNTRKHIVHSADTKISDIINTIGLNDRMVNILPDLESISFDLDYSPYEKRISDFRQNSLNYLKESLK